MLWTGGHFPLTHTHNIVHMHPVCSALNHGVGLVFESNLTCLALQGSVWSRDSALLSNLNVMRFPCKTPSLPEARVGQIFSL